MGQASLVKKCKQLGFNSIDENLKTNRVPASRLPIDFTYKVRALKSNALSLGKDIPGALSQQ